MPDTCVAMEAETIAASDALHKAVEARRRLEWNLPKKYEMARWVREQAKAPPSADEHGRRRHFLDRCGNDPGRAEILDREIEKLAVYCRGARRRRPTWTRSARRTTTP